MTTKTELSGLVAKMVLGEIWRSGRSALTSRSTLNRLPRGVVRTSFDPLDPVTVANPYPGYQRLLESGRVHYSARRDIWMLCRYEDVRAAARADGVLSSAQGVLRSKFTMPAMLTVDRPDHTRLRRMAQPAFTRGALEARQPVVDQLADELTAEMVARRETDAVADLAVPMPIRVIAEILGIPAQDQANFRRWSDQALASAQLDMNIATLTRGIRVLNGIGKLHSYFHAQFRSGGLLGADTVLGQLLETSHEGRITDDELFWFAVLLLLAGHETTTNMLGTLIYNLAHHPDQYERLREQPELVSCAIEEQLRHSSPIQGLYRTALDDYPVGDMVIPRGARVLLLFGAANRDPRRFPDPDRFLIGRDTGQHVAFGSGIHLCLGAQLARMEGQAVLRELVDRVRRIAPAGPAVWDGKSSFLGLAALPVRFLI